MHLFRNMYVTFNQTKELSPTDSPHNGDERTVSVMIITFNINDMFYGRTNQNHMKHRQKCVPMATG